VSLAVRFRTKILFCDIQRVMSNRIQKTLVVLLTVIIAAAAGIAALRHLMTEMFRPKASWRTNTLHVYSAKDGPWVITHLIMLRSGTNGGAIAQLPSPSTITDSRGEHFTTNFLQALTWITHSGKTSAPPEIGHPMRVFYFVPEESR